MTEDTFFKAKVIQDKLAKIARLETIVRYRYKFVSEEVEDEFDLISLDIKTTDAITRAIVEALKEAEKELREDFKAL